MKQLWFQVLALALLSCVVPQHVEAAKVTSNITFDTRSVQTTLWYPDALSLIRGVIVFTGGASSTGSGDTRGMVNMPFWQKFAESVGFALLGNQFTGSYANAAAGSGQALLDSLQSLAANSGHAELVHTPLLVEGFSNGGYFSYTFTQFIPARVIAFCLNKSGFANAPLDPAFLAVPGLLIWGSEEPVRGVPTVVHALAQQGRAQHALWGELKEWGAAHEEGSADWVFAPFFAEMIAARYPSGVSPLHADVQLLPLTETNGWLGDTSDASLDSALPRIAAFTAYAGDRQTAAWLPSESLALLWRGFATKVPLALVAPTPSTVYDATRPLQLSVSGLVGGESASFNAGATTLVTDVAANGGTATTTWNPSWGGARGVIALARDAQRVVTRTSRPANIVLTGKVAPGPGVGQPVPATPGWFSLVGASVLLGVGWLSRRRYLSRSERQRYSHP